VRTYRTDIGINKYGWWRFPVWWEHFDLAVGDTIEIGNPLYDGRKFFIEEIRRLDEFRAQVWAVEWG
jgi:hypothetical protein